MLSAIGFGAGILASLPGRQRDVPLGVMQRAFAGDAQGPEARGPRGLALGHTRQKLDLKAMLATRETSAELTITTDEGDVVTLSARSELEVSYARFRAKSRGPEGRSSVKGEFQEIRLDREFSLTVEGDLNEQELADIRALVDQMRPALTGLSPESGERLAFQLDGSAFESLAGFSLELERSVSLTRIHLKRRAFTQPAVPERTEPPRIEKPGPARLPIREMTFIETAAALAQRSNLPAPMPAMEARDGDA